MLIATFNSASSPTAIPANTLTPISTDAHTPPVWPAQTSLPSLAPGQSFVLTQIHMSDENNGWGIESTGHLLRTVDGGSTWKDVTPPEVGFFSTADTMHAWDIVETREACEICPSGWARGLVTWRTSDGGQTWQQGLFFIPDMLGFRPRAMQFVDDTNGWFLFVERVGMSGFIFESLMRTMDGGESWMQVHPLSDGCVSGGMIFVDEQEGWIGDDCRGLSYTLDGIPLQDFLIGKAAPSLNRTTDGGNTWNSFPVPAPTVFPSNFTPLDIDPNTWFYCGIKQMDKVSQKAFLLQWSCNTAHSTISAEVLYAYLTTDGGQTWHSWLSTGNESFVNPNVGWRLFVPGNGQPNGLQHTMDGGVTWTTIKAVDWQTAHFDFVTEQMGWAIVTNADASAFIHTTDGGVTWTELKPAIANR